MTKWLHLVLTLVAFDTLFATLPCQPDFRHDAELWVESWSQSLQIAVRPLTPLLRALDGRQFKLDLAKGL